eukprot:COSAG01_NODE_3267_length_6330_cov_133.385331_8_plen_50_part_00
MDQSTLMGETLSGFGLTVRADCSKTALRLELMRVAVAARAVRAAVRKFP